MKTLLASVLLALLILTGCSKSDDPTPVLKPAPLPKLKNVTSYLYNYDVEGKLIENRRLAWSQEVYDIEGVLLKKQYRKAHYLTDYENPLFTENNTYENGLLIKKEILRSDHSTYNTYNKYLYVSGTLDGYDYYSISGGTHYLLQKHRYEYSASGQPLKKLFYDSAPFEDAPTVYEYTYDNRGNVTREHITGSNKYAGTYEREFDIHNNLTRETFTLPWASSTTVVFTYQYNASNQITEKIAKYSRKSNGNNYDSGSYKYIYNYDEKSLLKDVDVYYADWYLTKNEFELSAKIKYTHQFHN